MGSFTFLVSFEFFLALWGVAPPQYKWMCYWRCLHACQQMEIALGDMWEIFFQKIQNEEAGPNENKPWMLPAQLLKLRTISFLVIRFLWSFSLAPPFITLWEDLFISFGLNTGASPNTLISLWSLMKTIEKISIKNWSSLWSLLRLHGYFLPHFTCYQEHLPPFCLLSSCKLLLLPFCCYFE